MLAPVLSEDVAADRLIRRTAVASNSREVTRKGPAIVDEDVPDPQSEWGWNGSFPRGGMAAGVFSIIALLAMLIGNHTGKIEDLYLVGFALLLVLGVVISVRNKRNAWRR
jgi:hypothetical protein